MAAANPPPPYVVLDTFVYLTPPPAGLDQEWAIVECARKTAYGCGEHGQMLVDGLTLYVRLVACPPADLASALYIHADDDALRGIRLEFDKGEGPPIPINDFELYHKCFIESVDENLLVLTVVFRFHDSLPINYYLVYSAADASLALIRSLPPLTWMTATTQSPLPVLRGDGDGGYELVVITERLLPPPPEVMDGTYMGKYTFHFNYEDVFCVWTPEAKSGEEDPAPGGGWRIQGRRFPEEVEQPFMAEVKFSFDGKAFFVDLSQGIVYGDVPAADDDSDVCFDFIPLPAETPSQKRWGHKRIEDTAPLNNYRTMRCVGGAIRFVCIGRVDRAAGQLYGDGTVTVWTLDLGTKRWTKDREFGTRELWRAAGGGLPATEPKCPVAMPDGTICFLMPAMRLRREDPWGDYILNLDVAGRDLRIVWSGRLRECSYIEPAIVRANFFEKLLCPLDSTTRKCSSSIYVEHEQ
ncbi:hypothetical protein ACP70R_025563 [Stipagrostis hirtigluma subsp. patula]